MKDIQAITKKLRKFYQSLAQTINSGFPIAVQPATARTAGMLMQKLQNMVIPYSESGAALLNDIRVNLFIPNPNGIIGVNPFRFGKLDAVLTYLESSDFVCDFAKYVNTPWCDINLSIRKLLTDSANADNRLSYNQVGVIAREIYILLAQKVYRSEMNDGEEVGPTDTKRMLDNFIKYTLSGSSNEDLRGYASKAVKLAEHVTHAKNEDKAAMDSLVTAVISLVSVINIIYKNKCN